MSTTDKYSAGASALGYMYQARLGLRRMLEVDEGTLMFIEKDDDLAFEEVNGKKSLASLKHKATGDQMSDFSIDFWKSVKIWVERYNRDGQASCTHQYHLLTTSTPKQLSFLQQLTPAGDRDLNAVLKNMQDVLDATKSRTILSVKTDYQKLDDDLKRDFIGRITVYENTDRIEDIPKVIMEKYMRAVRVPHRPEVYSRLEGWWTNEVIKLLIGERTGGLFSREVSDKLGFIADEYKVDNLPITFGDAQPSEEPDPENDNRLFVRQLHSIGLKTTQIRRAIIDYYRAFEQRASWARLEADIGEEIELYEDKLVDEWGRNKDIIHAKVKADSAEEFMQDCGRSLYNWAEINTGDLRIRPNVSERFVVRGSFHMLANEKSPRVHWHPLFLERLQESLK